MISQTHAACLLRGKNWTVKNTWHQSLQLHSVTEPHECSLPTATSDSSCACVRVSACVCVRLFVCERRTTLQDPNQSIFDESCHWYTPIWTKFHIVSALILISCTYANWNRITRWLVELQYNQMHMECLGRIWEVSCSARLVIRYWTSKEMVF